MKSEPSFALIAENLGVMVKSVTDIKTTSSEEKCAGIWLEVNKKTGLEEKHLYHLSKNIYQGERVKIEFPFPTPNTTRTTIHFSRDPLQKNPSTRVVAGRFKEDKYFGFSVEGQKHLNLKYEITDESGKKHTGFNALFLEIGLPEKNPLHLKIEIWEENHGGKRVLVLTAEKISENQIPDCLKEAQLVI